ncbi:SPOR domain-containing protein [Celeribacter litoreus]|uniref:SPOR domain-containing protein n=1 Tax=Celeribacter litoreus TaxID=2876714 RepID=UPI001CD00F3E|nr:SPOR domain-containing protein [Celeribacter litoreus]MCA0043136.1 SPOR domain-containing protein [Celeribacter litoreus]
MDSFKSPQTTSSEVTTTTGNVIERDVEAPEVFEVTDRGLWDGRPSLGGVWVAHSDVTDPERVIIRNTSNGNFVIGALFKRESTSPGPGIQVSSDAAEALGLLAGAPAELSVIALRREEVVEEVPVSINEEPAIVDTIEDSEAIETMTLTDPIADAAATLDALETPAATMPKPKPTAPAPAPAQTAPATPLSKPFLQIGIFSVEANAKRTVEMLGSQGLDAEIKAGESNGKAFWRVIVGPATTSAELKSLLEKVKQTGFTDAYAVTH